MTIDSGTTRSPDFVSTLTQAAQVFRAKVGNRNGMPQAKLPAPGAVTHALLQAEKAAKQQRQTYPVESLLGHWRLCFTTARKVTLRQGEITGKPGFYAPQFTPAQISFTSPASSTEVDPNQLEIGNQIQLGSLMFRVMGQARYLGKKNLLAFDFSHMQLSLFGATLYQGGFPGRKTQSKHFQDQPIAKLPFFAFFFVTEDLIAARGRGGGLAVWVRER